MMSVFQKLNKKYPLLLYLVTFGCLKISVYSLNGEELLKDQGKELYEVAAKAANQSDERFFAWDKILIGSFQETN